MYKSLNIFINDNNIMFVELYFDVMCALRVITSNDFASYFLSVIADLVVYVEMDSSL